MAAFFALASFVFLRWRDEFRERRETLLQEFFVEAFRREFTRGENGETRDAQITRDRLRRLENTLERLETLF